MALGMKRARYGHTDLNYTGDIDQATKPQRVTFADSTVTSVTNYIGGVGGTPTGTTSLVIQINYKTAAGVLKTDGYIDHQKGRKQFNCISAAGGAATLTRATLTAVAPASLAASQASVKAVAPDGTLFYATRISNRFVWNGDTRYAYVLGNTDAVTYIDGTSGVTFTDQGGNTITGGLAVVEGF